ncbi:MAG: Crp/Fnr family transcriptional regulator [Maritimibacter sp.]|nr:Crp/Fnr family transcriptional regulator [Maritimibacter sp.]
MNQEHERIARTSLLLASAPADVVDALLARAVVSHAGHGETVFSQGDRADAIYIVLDGWVKLFRIAPSGTEAVVGVFTRGHSFGEAVALRRASYPVFAEAVTDCILLRLDARELLRHLDDNPKVAISMLTATYAHLHNLVAQVEQLKAQTGPQRVADFLLELTKSPVGSCSVQLPYDKVLIAGRLGMKPESLSRAFSKLREHGVRIQQNSAEIDDVESLRSYAERDRAMSWHQD